MTKNNSCKNLKMVVGAVFKKSSVDIDGKEIPLLTKNTEQIVVNCNDGEVTDVKPTYRFK